MLYQHKKTGTRVKVVTEWDNGDWFMVEDQDGRIFTVYYTEIEKDDQATKKVKTSSRDMLLLIRKFNINPNTTNPATIFQRPNSKQSGNDFPFPDKFPAATPI